jgi:hypothetical protein
MEHIPLLIGGDDISVHVYCKVLRNPGDWGYEWYKTGAMIYSSFTSGLSGMANVSVPIGEAGSQLLIYVES